MYFYLCFNNKFISNNGYTENSDQAICLLTYSDAEILAKTFLRFNLDVDHVSIVMWDKFSKPIWLCDVLQKGIIL